MTARATGTAADGMVCFTVTAAHDAGFMIIDDDISRDFKMTVFRAIIPHTDIASLMTPRCTYIGSRPRPRQPGDMLTMFH